MTLGSRLLPLRGVCILGLALGLLASCAIGGQLAPAPVPAAWGHEGDLALGPLLWQVEGRGGGALYLFGTMHTETASSVSPTVWQRFQDARTLAFETDLTALGVEAVVMKALLPPTESLDTLLGAEAWDKIRDYLKDTMPEQALIRIQPWFVVSLVLLKASGLKPGEDMMDLALMKRGRDAGKALHFLESPEEQSDIVARTFDAKAVAALATNIDRLPALIQRMTASYRTGDVRGLEAVLADKEHRLGLSDDQLRLLLGARNERWMPLLERLTAKGDGFVAVGAGHLPGKDGLVALLRERGYRVTRVPAAR